MEKVVLHEPVIDEKILFAVSLFGMLRVADKAFDTDQFGDAFNGNEFGIDVFPEYIYQTLPDTRYREVVYLVVVITEAKGYIRMCQGYPQKFVDDIAQFRIVGFQKFPPGRDIEEKIFDTNVGSFRGVYDLLLFDFGGCDK